MKFEEELVIPEENDLYKISETNDGKLATRYLAAVTDRDDRLLRDLWNLFLTDELANSVIVALSTVALGEHFEIINADGDEKTFWEEALKRNWGNLWELVAEALIFGNSYAMIIPNRVNEFLYLKPLFPLDVKKTEKNGEVIYSYEGKEYKQGDRKIFEFYFFQRADSLYATSLLAPMKNALDRKRSSEENIDKALNRHFPRFHIQVSRDPRTNRYPTPSERKAMAEKFETLTPDQEFVSTDLIKIDTLDRGDRGGIPDIEAYMLWFTNAVYIGARIPPEILGSSPKTTTHATAKARVNTFLSFMIPFYQRSIEYLIKTQIMYDTKADIDIKPPAELALPYSK